MAGVLLAAHHRCKRLAAAQQMVLCQFGRRGAEQCQKNQQHGHGGDGHEPGIQNASGQHFAKRCHTHQSHDKAHHQGQDAADFTHFAGYAQVHKNK